MRLAGSYSPPVDSRLFRHSPEAVPGAGRRGRRGGGRGAGKAVSNVRCVPAWWGRTGFLLALRARTALDTPLSGRDPDLTRRRRSTARPRSTARVPPRLYGPVGAARSAPTTAPRRAAHRSGMKFVGIAGGALQHSVDEFTAAPLRQRRVFHRTCVDWCGTIHHHLTHVRPDSSRVQAARRSGVRGRRDRRGCAAASRQRGRSGRASGSAASRRGR
jgi:hypothetical protein